MRSRISIPRCSLLLGQPFHFQPAFSLPLLPASPPLLATHSAFALSPSPLQLPNRKLEVELTMLSSNYHVEMSPGDVGNNDRYVVQAIIKEMAKSRPLDSTGGGKRGRGQGGRDGEGGGRGEGWERMCSRGRKEREGMIGCV